MALMMFHIDFSVIALIGVILLIGIVKKNANHDGRLRARRRAQSLSVPVVGSIWLSVVVSVPVASLVLPLRSKAVTGSVALARRRLRIWGTLSSGTVKITVMGFNWVITARFEFSVVCT